MKKSILLVSMLSFVILGPLFLAPQDLSAEESTGGNSEEITTLNEQIKEKKEKIKQIEKSIESYRAQIDQKRTEAVSLSNQMAFLDNRQTQVELDIEITQEKLETLNLEIEALELEIEDKSATIDRQQTILSELIRTLHMRGDKSFLEILAVHDNFSDFFNEIQTLENVQQRMGNSAKTLRLAKVDLEDKKGQTEERKVSFEELSDELEQARDNLEEQLYAKQDLLAKTQSSELQYQTLVNNLKNQFQSIESEISGIEQEVRQRLAEQDQLNNQAGSFDGQLSWPTQSRYVTAYFFDPTYPYRNIFEHNAIDIRAAHGTPVKASASGYVARAKRCTSATCYAFVMIVHSGGISTVYGHLSNIVVTEDQFVTRGTVIGYSGATPGTVGAGPFSTGPHLHFETRKNGVPVDPLSLLIKDY